MSDPAARLAAAKARVDAAGAALREKHRGNEVGDFQAAHDELLAAERQLAASRNEEHAAPCSAFPAWDIGAPLPHVLTGSRGFALAYFTKEPDPTWDGTWARAVDVADESLARVALALLDRAHLLDEVIEAVLHHRLLSIEYTRFSGNVERFRVEPLSIVVHDHQLYVVGRVEGAIHPYRFARVRAVDVLDDTFNYPSRTEYDPQQVFRDSFGIFLDLPVQDVEVRLDKQWVTYAQSHRWHDSQVVDVADDHVRVRMRVRVCPEFEAWILGFGEQAEVIAPTALRERITKREAGALKLYEAGAAAPRPALRKAGPRVGGERKRGSGAR